MNERVRKISYLNNIKGQIGFTSTSLLPYIYVELNVAELNKNKLITSKINT